MSLTLFNGSLRRFYLWKQVAVILRVLFQQSLELFHAILLGKFTFFQLTALGVDGPDAPRCLSLVAASVDSIHRWPALRWSVVIFLNLRKLSIILSRNNGLILAWDSICLVSLRFDIGYALIYDSEPVLAHEITTSDGSLSTKSLPSNGLINFSQIDRSNTADGFLLWSQPVLFPLDNLPDFLNLFIPRCNHFLQILDQSLLRFIVTLQLTNQILLIWLRTSRISWYPELWHLGLFFIQYSQTCLALSLIVGILSDHRKRLSDSGLRRLTINSRIRWFLVQFSVLVVALPVHIRQLVCINTAIAISPASESVVTIIRICLLRVHIHNRFVYDLILWL